MNPSNGGWVILLTVLIAMLLAIVHLPESWPGWLGWLRPNWLVLVVFFWVIELPHRLGLFAAWLAGIMLDALQGDPLGLNGFILATVTYVAWKLFERLRMYSMLQQCGVIFALVLGSELLRMLVIDLTHSRGWEWPVLFIPLTSMVAWPFVYILLLRLRTGARVE